MQEKSFPESRNLVAEVDAIRDEMAAGVRLLGGGPEVIAKHANQRAARVTGLPIQTIERLRWRKIKRIPADVYLAVTSAMERHAQRIEQKARHDAAVLDALLAHAPNVDLVALDEGSDQPPTPR